MRFEMDFIPRIEPFLNPDYVVLTSDGV